MSTDAIPEQDAPEETVQGAPEEQPQRRTPQWNVYSVMLLISFLFLCGASLLLWTEFSSYGFQWRPVR
jgi:hypothetical protein